MDDWGEIKLKQINSDDFWNLFEEIINDRSGFFYNKNCILQAYKDGNLFGLEVDETDSMYKRGARMDKIFCEKSFYLLPCFCVIDNNKAIIIWIHTRARKMGFAKKLIKLLKIEYALHPLPESIEFWNKNNIKLI